MDGCPLGLGLVVEDKPTEFSCNATLVLDHRCRNRGGGGGEPGAHAPPLQPAGKGAVPPQPEPCLS